MPAFYNGNRIKRIFSGTQSIEKVYYGKKLVWDRYPKFSTLSWEEIGRMIQDGSWIENKWELGNLHKLRFKDGTSGTVRIIGIYDYRINGGTEENPDQEPFQFQVDKQINGENAHLTLELTTCLPEEMSLFDSDAATPQTWSESNIYLMMQPGGAIYENLPDDFKQLVLPVIKKSGVTGEDTESTPIESENYLFIPSLIEYIGESDYEYNVNSSEGAQYQLYFLQPELINKKILNGDSTNIMYYTRSASAFSDALKDYFWAIGSFTSFSVYPSSTSLGISFACCI